MSYPTQAPVTNKSAYQRPYKSRIQRREADRRKYDETKDYKFLIQVAVGVVLVIVLALAFALKGTFDSPAALTEATR
ncbi:MAG: hypothetical protein JWR44_3258 [Hymenobacter sp.]|jgi:cytochrome c-type biogenesis protein CcmH/NrfG|nr:hypothetical protein [Hymenobacter sp.]